MYQRSYEHNVPENRNTVINEPEVPPNYRGNAFTMNTPPYEIEEPQEDLSSLRPRVPVDEGWRRRPAPKPPLGSKISSIFSGEKKLEIDDILLCALIVMLFQSHADDELLIILALLFVIGF